MDKQALHKLFDDMQQLHVVVIGDVMLDNYRWGIVERQSPEAPVPVVTVKKRDNRLGGAANVALNCIALGTKATLASIVGDDNDGAILEQLANDAGIDTTLLVKSHYRPTTTKTRVIVDDKHMMRLDEEVCEDLTTEEEHPFIDRVMRYLQIEKPQVVIFEDYNKGVLKENVIDKIVQHCKHLGIITAVDPKKKNFLAYNGVTIFKPNLKEVREGLDMQVAEVNITELDVAHEVLHQSLQHDVTFITLSEKGVYYNDGNSAIIPTHKRDIKDVSGAGDTVIATASVIFALTKDAKLMAEVSNIAGGLVCEQVGVVPIDKNRLMEGCQSHLFVIQ
ncbi:carbohydrate kinase [Chitinophagaceae bacterium IBVUCB1]|nr:carbohydrate kinase [Chitinophagaceae bacterium IBVUCB1]